MKGKTIPANPFILPLGYDYHEIVDQIEIDGYKLYKVQYESSEKKEEIDKDIDLNDEEKSQAMRNEDAICCSLHWDKAIPEYLLDKYNSNE